ncbi:DUF4271 domain-containing protein [uncultured Alistipes sp.]|uniref:DUF4271 domain-containing protein n=1 Tax=uncultured Alistipes sp. TaxID=538949 RepID=UPI002613F632|nr:DUF4271 domain-containing protein [uncultured Alistipes sp.]
MKSLTMILHPVPAGGTGRSASEGASAQGAALQAEAAVPGTDVQAGAEQEGTAQEAAAQKAAALWYGDEVVAYREAADSLHTQRQGHASETAGAGARHADEAQHTAGHTATQHTADARHSAAVGSASPAAAGMRVETQTETQTEAAAQLPDSLAAAMPDSLRMEADSLTGSLAGADTLWESPLGAFMPGDSLYAHATTLHYLPDGTPLEDYRTVGAGEFFGQQSLLAAPRPAAQQQPRLTDELPFQGLVLLLTLLFGLLLYRNPGDMRALVGRVAFERRDSERTSDESGNAGFTRFLNIALALGFLLAGVTAVRLCDRPDIAQELLSMGNGSTLSLLLALGVGLLFLLVYLYGILLLRAVGGVTLTSGFTTQLIRIKRGYAALGAIILAPVILLFALSPLGSDTIWAGLLTAGWLITFLLYLRETFALFISKKVSILHWILYLCAVEIFPVTLLWLLVVR